MLQNDFARFLGLESPFRIELRSKQKKSMTAVYWAIYTDGGKGKLHSHLIRVYLGNQDSRDLDTLIAHELIHAWQEENKHTDIHGKSFRKMARRMSKQFDLPNIYLKKVDTP